jgi:hypothetical protein
LSNFETPRRKLMHIVLSGQPQLETKLAQPHLTQLRQRISLISRLKPLEPADVHNYVKWRLHIAGVPDITVFEPDALDLIALQSEGVPRNINNLCFHSLSLGYAKGRSTITRDVVEEAIMDNQLILGAPIATPASQPRSNGDSKPPFVPPAPPPPPVEFSAEPSAPEAEPEPQSQQQQQSQQAAAAVPFRSFPNLGPIAKVQLQQPRRSYRAAVYACATIVVGSLLIFHNLPQRIADASQSQSGVPNLAPAASPNATTPAQAAPNQQRSAPETSSAPSTPAAEAPTATTPSRTVVVQPHETLWTISQRELPDVAPSDGIDQILELNAGIDPKRLRAGQEILLPSPREEQRASDSATADGHKQSLSSRSEQ